MAQADHNINGRGRRWSLEGMTALVTGGTKGIGYAIVEELAGLGASVHTCSRNEAQLNGCLTRWKMKGFHQVTGSVSDVVSKTQREELIHKVSSLFNGKLDILINNVGAYIAKPTTEYTAEDYSFLLGTNLGVYLQFVPTCTSSPQSFGSCIYGATKGAINQLAKTLACEWGKDKVRINSVAPWVIKTTLVEEILNDQKVLEAINSRTPLGDPGSRKSLCVQGP
ncbi:hypothetical protein M0R45_017261 [Rubus argutus]|uniref:Uncharacterized protein n=1 Tax=Rubus argutus TaxID=59490 RepID=A0AAW1XVM1_RUBAR